MEIIEIERKGKFLIWHFKSENSNSHAINHLGMTGVWHLYSEKVFRTFEPLEKEFKHLKVYFKLDGDLHLIFVNIRKFGRFLVENYQNILSNPSISQLGPDILDESFDFEEFEKRIAYRKVAVGKALLNSAVVAGCGNIYKCEALFRAKIDPFRTCNQLSTTEIKRLGSKLHEVGLEALKNKGSTLKDFKHVDGYSGLMQNSFQVYGRKDDLCFICNSKIQAEKQGDRTTFFCANCQN